MSENQGELPQWMTHDINVLRSVMETTYPKSSTHPWGRQLIEAIASERRHELTLYEEAALDLIERGYHINETIGADAVVIMYEEKIRHAKSTSTMKDFLGKLLDLIRGLEPNSKP